MKVAVSLHNPNRYPVNSNRLRAAAMSVGELHSARQNAGMIIALVDAKAMRDMNRRFRGMDAATDVLAFGADSEPAVPDNADRHLGDIVIAPEVAAAKARARKLDPGEILCLLVVHGALHLLGHDHDAPATTERMWAAQSQALRGLGIEPELAAEYGAGE